MFHPDRHRPIAASARLRRSAGRPPAVGQKHPPKFEDLHVARPPGRVGGKDLDESGHERGAQRVVVLRERIHDAHARHRRLRRRDQGQRQRFDESTAGEQGSHTPVRRDGRRDRARRRGTARHRERHAIVAVHPDDLFDQVLLAHEIGTKRRRHHRERTPRGDRAPERAERAGHLRRRDLDAEQRDRAGRPQADRARRDPRGAHIHEIPRRTAPGDFREEHRRARLRPRRRVGIGAPLKPRHRLRPHAEPARGAGDRRRIPVRRLEQDRGGLRPDLGRPPAHDAGERHRAPGIRDDQHRVVERARDLVQRLKRLAGPRAPHDQPVPVDAVVVEGVHRLPRFEHHVVGHVDDVVDRAHPSRLEAPPHPLGSRSHAHTLDHGRGKPGTPDGIVDGDGGLRGRGGGLRTRPARTRGSPPRRGAARVHQARRAAHTASIRERDLARDAEQTQAVGAVGRDLEVEHHLVPDALNRFRGQPDLREAGGQHLRLLVDLHVFPQPLERHPHRRPP